MGIPVGQVSLEWIFEFRRHHPDDLVMGVVQLQVSPQHIRFCPEHGRPQGVTDNGDLFMPRLVVVSPDSTPQLWLRLKRGKEISVDSRCPYAFLSPCDLQAEHCLLEVRHGLVRTALALDVIKIPVAWADHLRRNPEI